MKKILNYYPIALILIGITIAISVLNSHKKTIYKGIVFEKSIQVGGNYEDDKQNHPRLFYKDSTGYVRHKDVTSKIYEKTKIGDMVIDTTYFDNQ